MNPELQLQQLGLTKNEAKVYLALLALGPTTTSAIIKHTGINTSKVYESLERLLKKGLVSYSLIKNKKTWQREDPQRLIDFLEEEKKKIEAKEKEAKILLPILQVKEQIEHPTQYKVFESIKGLKTARENVLNVLKPGDTFYVILSNYPNDRVLEAYWFDFQIRRAKKKIKCMTIFNEDLRELGKKREKLAFTQMRYVRPEILSPTWIEIYHEYVGIGVLGSKPSIFIIKNQSIAEGFLNYFQFLWKTGKN